jgi:hypothetical protein
MTGRGSVWSKAERLFLLEIWRDEDVEGQLQGSHRNYGIYTRLSELMTLQGYPRSPEQCRNKLKALRGEWAKLQKNLSKSGTSARSLGENPEHDVLDDVLGTRPIHNPTMVVDTLALNSSNADDNMMDHIDDYEPKTSTGT